MKLSVSSLKTLLVKPGHVTSEVFDGAVIQAKKSKQNIPDVLIAQGVLRDRDWLMVLSEYLGYPPARLSKKVIQADVLSRVPEIVSRSRGVIAFSKDKNGVHVGMLDPTDVVTRHMLEKRFDMPVVPYLMLKHQLKEALSAYTSNIDITFKKLKQVIDDVDASDEERDSAVVSMVDTVLQHAHRAHASDVHIEPYEERVLVRYRIDGVLHDVIEIPKDLHPVVLTRLKIMARLRTDEHRAAQDGKLRFKDEEHVIDVRVSIVPVSYGENVVMRLLSSEGRSFALADLGLRSKDQEILRNAIKDPHGMILSTGPTGSGKTTTLYALMQLLNKRDVHISTIEDPVEYAIEGISQIQVNTRTDLTFANGLRSIVRQDPDIIMVGEIRDQETAGIAVNSAMTGHLVLSTLHTNTAAGTLPRLIDMGIEPFLVASTVNVIIGQRLVRKVCETCRQSVNMTKKHINLLKFDPDIQEFLLQASRKSKLSDVTLFQGKGCSTCANAGYTGRLGLYEIMVMEDNVQEAVMQRKSSAEILEVAKQNGMQTMAEDGVAKILQGLTTLEEVLRVTKQ